MASKSIVTKSTDSPFALNRDQSDHRTKSMSSYNRCENRACIKPECDEFSTTANMTISHLLFFYDVTKDGKAKSVKTFRRRVCIIMMKFVMTCDENAVILA